MSSFWHLECLRAPISKKNAPLQHVPQRGRNLPKVQEKCYKSKGYGLRIDRRVNNES
jgi:hypothetical protein